MDSINLTTIQEDSIDANWDKMDLKSLTRLVFNDNSLDGRSLQAKAIKEYIANQGKQVATTKRKKAKPVILDAAAKKYIENHCDKCSSVVMARTIFQDNTLTALSKEARAIQAYVKQVDPDLVKPDEEIADKDYVPPKAFSRLIMKVNEAVNLNFTEDKLSDHERSGLEALGRFLNYGRFLHVINSYKTVGSRKIFEMSFVSAVYDKPDLSVEELNQYINLCIEYVLQGNINRQMEHLNGLLDNCGTDKDMSIRLTDAINVKTKEYNDCVKRQQQLHNDLSGKRSARVSKVNQENYALTAFFQLWKDKEKRGIMLEIAKKRKLLVKEELDRLASLDELFAKVQGMGYDDIL